MTKFIVFGITMIFAALFVSGCLGSNPEKRNDIVTPITSPIITPTPEQKIDVSKIDIKFDEYKFDLYFYGEGGPNIAYSMVTIRNNNNQPIKVEAVCTDRSTMELNYILCTNSELTTIDAFTSKVLQARWYVGSEAGGEHRKSKPGTYYGALELHLYDESDLAQIKDLKDFDRYGKILAEAPVTLRVYDLLTK
jgi:hypothetical protein